mmetsp:Transcript_34385/g.74460  ORF Transcript_34385/g.74460 Transcript_34385/m.74460 type:complete len:779 (-) Transcript_34385:30-2366(-)
MYIRVILCSILPFFSLAASRGHGFACGGPDSFGELVDELLDEISEPGHGEVLAGAHHLRHAPVDDPRRGQRQRPRVDVEEAHSHHFRGNVQLQDPFTLHFRLLQLRLEHGRPRGQDDLVRAELLALRHQQDVAVLLVFKQSLEVAHHGIFHGRFRVHALEVVLQPLPGRALAMRLLRRGRREAVGEVLGILLVRVAAGAPLGGRDAGGRRKGKLVNLLVDGGGADGFVERAEAELHGHLVRDVPRRVLLRVVLERDALGLLVRVGPHRHADLDLNHAVLHLLPRHFELGAEDLLTDGLDDLGLVAADRRLAEPHARPVQRGLLHDGGVLHVCLQEALDVAHRVLLVHDRGRPALVARCGARELRVQALARVPARVRDAVEVAAGEERVAEQLPRRGPLLPRREALADEGVHAGVPVVHLVQALRPDAPRHLAVDLGRVLALVVRELARDQLQQAHSKGINIYELVVLFIIHLRGHELWGAQDGHPVVRAPEQGGEPQVADLDLAAVPVDEDVVALEIPVDDGGVVLLVQVHQPFQDLHRPPLDGLEVDLAVLAPELAQRAAREELGDEGHVARVPADPRVVEGDDVWMVQLRANLDLRRQPLLLLGRKGPPLHQDLVPRDFPPFELVNRLVDLLEGALPEQVVQLLVPARGVSPDHQLLVVQVARLLLLLVLLLPRGRAAQAAAVVAVGREAPPVPAAPFGRPLLSVVQHRRPRPVRLPGRVCVCVWPQKKEFVRCSRNHFSQSDFRRLQRHAHRLQANVTEKKKSKLTTASQPGGIG